MDAAHKALLVEEGKQKCFREIVDKAHQGSNQADSPALRDEIIKVGICEPNTVKGLVETIFNKAIEDPLACQTLADVCQLMPAHFDPVDSGPAAPKEKGAGSRSSSEKRIDFRLTLIKKAKDELEKGVAARKLCKEWEAKEGAGDLKGDDKKEAEVDRAAAARMLAAVQFCGCLYSVGILTDKVIHSYVESLLKDAEADPRVEDAESLFGLLKLIGAKLEVTTRGSKDGKAVAQWFVRIAKIKEEAVSADVAKIMDNVLTLRAANWEGAASA